MKPARTLKVGYPGEGIVTTRLTEANGITTLTATVLSESKQTRDAVIASGMEQGASQTYDRLDALLLTHT
ncbi:MAG TPA: SRPBCC domain-containing protein [Rhizomicrobium sp.]|nr:SRPBCC domain-containing protein [Rhizomicrobium sp.]